MRTTRYSALQIVQQNFVAFSDMDTRKYRLLNGAQPTLSDQSPEDDENPDLDQATNACNCRGKEHITQRHGARLLKPWFHVGND